MQYTADYPIEIITRQNMAFNRLLQAMHNNELTIDSKLDKWHFRFHG